MAPGGGAVGGMLYLASTPKGQMATAVFIVLLAWAVLTKRIYVLEFATGSTFWQDLCEVAGLSEVEVTLPTRERKASVVRGRFDETEHQQQEHDDDVVTAEEEDESAFITAGAGLPGGDLVAPTKASSQKSYRRRWPKKSEARAKPREIHGLCGPAPRDLSSRRLLGRPGAYWSEPDAAGLKIRGPTYLMDKVKVAVGKPLFFLLDCDLFDLPQQTDHVARYLSERMAALWKDYAGGGPGGGGPGTTTTPQTPRYTVIIQLQVPGPPWKSFVMYFGIANRRAVFDVDTPFARVAKKFFSPQNTTPTSGDPTLHKWRNNTFKLIPRCVNAPFVVKRAVGEVPTLLGNKLQQAYYGTSDYFEVDVNISSSRIAQYTVGLALNYAAVVVCDLAFVLQGASPAELPEKLVGCMRIEHIVMKDATPLDIHEYHQGESDD
eukprot:CAMPEP_0118914004 /NCGR_PEP_ID=MMETSP1166-20130328/14548_1 /TAXON_ID=1104430 /ORGANISM="Chrysoreinhardia sp, Strain CCMP3193" /LENGTH=433 /DNA_ID=CAMNT_0006853569 /DNA_START=71 /DNA_END=1372 /DNA_ORIENTATION=-